jgi:hypothetical protein
MLGSGKPDEPNVPEFVARGTIEAALQLPLCCSCSWDEAGILAANMV